MKNKRKWLFKDQAIFLGLKPKESETNRSQARYSLNSKQLKSLEDYYKQPKKRSFVETIKKKDKDGNLISLTEKLQSETLPVPDNFEVIKISTSKTTGQQWIQYAPKKKDISKIEKEIDFESILKKYVKPITHRPKIEIKKGFDSLTYTDMHIGLDTDKHKNSMYADKWDAEEVIKVAKLICNEVLKNKQHDLIVVDELGDFFDGYNGFTTRGGHELPQNMTNEEVFDCGLYFKTYLGDFLSKHYKKVVFNNICNDNHAGSFGYFVNKAFLDLANIKYNNVEVNNYRTFLSHYFIEDICFVITHGKDDKTLKFGFKPELDTKQIEKIDQYLKHNGVYKKSKRIIFKKGDSHQALFNMCGSDDFDYYNYPAASPSSQWVQNNFKKGRKGFVLETFKGLTNTIKPIFY